MKSLSNKIDDILKKSSHLIWLNDYKTYGRRSYVYQDKNILYELYEDYNLCMNDDMIRDEAFDYVIGFNKNVGKAISSIYGIDSKYELSLLNDINTIVNSSVAMNAIFKNATGIKFLPKNQTFIKAINNSSLAITKYITALAGLNHSTYSSINDMINNSTSLNAIVKSETAMSAMFNSSLTVDALVNSEIAMNAVTSSGPALRAIAKSTADWNVKKPFIIKLNEIDQYIKNVYNILIDTNYFTCEVSDNYGNGEVTNLNQYCDISHAENGFIACALGSDGSFNGYGTRLKINGDIIKEARYPNNAEALPSLSSRGVNAIAIPTATFEDIGDGWAHIAVYVAN